MNKSDFISTELGEVTTLSQGLAINAKTSHLLCQEGLPLLRIKDLISGNAEQFVVPEEAPRKAFVDFDDIVFTRTGQVGLVFRGRKGVLHNNSFKVDPDPKILSKGFLFWFLRQKSIYQYVNQAASGSVQKDLKHDLFRQIEIDIPDLPTQERVVNVLDCLEEKIELNQKTNETLEGIAKALFKSWFVDFDPVRAKAEGRPTGLPDEISDLFPDSFEESELGDIPSGWSISSIYDCAKVIYGAPFSSKLFNSERKGVPLARIRDLKTGSPGVYTEEVHAKGCLIEPGDTVVGMDGEFRPYLWSSEKCWMNQRVCKFVPTEKRSNFFVRESITRPLMNVELSETATTVIHLGKSDIDRFKIVLPTEGVLGVFDSLASSIEAKVVVLNQQSKTLSLLRDALLPRLISGELRVPDAEKMLEEAGT